MISREVIFVLGGCRSGKSSYAKQYAEKHYQSGIFAATAQPLDDEMKERINNHQMERGDFWETKEVYFDLSSFLNNTPLSPKVILIDCLTLWVSNILLRDGPKVSERENEALIMAIANCQSPIILVSNEVGAGIVPSNALSRQFRDLTGWLNQKVALQAHKVIHMVAGIATTIK